MNSQEMRKIHQKPGYSIKCYRVGTRALISSLKVSMLPVDLSFLKITFWKSWALVVIPGILSIPGFAQTLVFSSTNPSVPVVSLSRSSVKRPIYRNVLVATGAFRDVAEVRELFGVFSKSGWKDCVVKIYAGEQASEMLCHLKRKTN